ncbi:F-box protein skip17 [Thalictrum thalictroides]|uniref:F-box protein skip17 n=1 Tax=Thalictrum thalictroides TaxID=46969 RepID=A0A7J6VTC0_THATH|nr:F-box protein skip17 [Thalictrum thalictroides]
MDRFLETFLGFSDSTSSISLDLSLERLIESRTTDSDQNQLIETALKLASLLLESAKRLQRKRFSKFNSISWVLPPDLTIKIFSMLDTQSLCHASGACLMFKKCAMDSLCYSNIDLTSVVPKVNNTVVDKMIRRADKHLQSLKLGILPAPSPSPTPSCPMFYTMRNSVDAGFSWNDRRSRQGKESYVLTRSCLTSLSIGNGSAGALLKRLHLYNIDRMDNDALCTALSSCPSLLDLEIVGLHIELRQTLESVSTNCPLLERLFFESSRTGRDDSLKSPTCVDLVNGCPNMTSLALRGFKLQDYKARVLLKGFRKLKTVDFSTSYSITGSFLRNLGCSTNGHLLEIIILRDCMHLKEIEAANFLTAVLDGDFKFLRHIDISNREGLASDSDWDARCYSPSIIIPVKRVLEERPDISLLAEFPPEGSFDEMDQIMNSDLNSDTSLPSQISSHSSDVSLFMSSSESSYNSDQGSGNEDAHLGGFDESSEEIDFLPV